MLISYKNANIYQRHGICVLKNINFQVEEGQFIYLIGRVGSGKTTLMRTLYCELDIDEADEATVLPLLLSITALYFGVPFHADGRGVSGFPTACRPFCL